MHCRGETGSKRIKGITIELNGDASGLSKALGSVEHDIVETEQALKDVNKLLKFDPKNTQLLEQKQKLLAQAIENTDKKLDALKEADKKAKQQLESGDLGREKYDILQREIIETEQRLESLNKQSANMNNINGFSAKLESLENKATAVGQALQPVSTAASALGAAMFATVPATEELRTDLSKLDQNAEEAGLKIDVVRKAFEDFNVVSDETDSSVEATSNLLQAGFTESNLQKAVEGLAGAYLSFPDTLKIESLADSLQETLATNKATGQFAELLDRIGIGAETFTNGLSGVSTEAEKQNYVLQTLADAGLMDTYNGWKENNKALVENKESNIQLQESLAELGDTLMPVATQVTEFMTAFIDGFNNLSPVSQGIIMIIIGLVAILAPLLTMFGTIAFGMTAAGTAAGGAALGFGAMSTSLLPILGVIALVVAAIIAIIAVIENWGAITEWIGNKYDKLKTWLSETVDSIKTKAVNGFWNMVDGIESCVDNVTDVVEEGFEGAISFITSLPSKALQWGSDFIDGLISGIKKKVSGIVDAVSGVAETIFSYLHFSRPDVGPLHYYEEWMPDFMDGLTKGIYLNMPKLSKAVAAVADTISYGSMKNVVGSNLDPNLVYDAVRSGASDAERPIILDGRRIDRSLKDRGVVYA